MNDELINVQFLFKKVRLITLQTNRTKQHSTLLNKFCVLFSTIFSSFDQGLRSQLHRYVFKLFRFHFVAFSNRPTLDCVFKCLRFQDRFHSFRVNRR